MTSKAARHIELRENSVREWVRDNTIEVQHVAGRVNPADIFTKEMRDGAHFRRLRDSFMSRLSDFVKGSILAVHPSSRRLLSTLAPAAASSRYGSFGFSGYLAALTGSSFLRSLSNVSHLCSAGRYLLRRAHTLVPSGVLCSFVGRKDGGCWSVLGPLVERVSRSTDKVEVN
jgi:hypothetical protein